jgi:hypothetical protein
VPRYSRLLDAIIVINKIDLVDSDQRSSLMQRFQAMQESAPIMHISFSVDPPGAYVQKIVGWLRENIHPLVLVRVGLQPNIGAGCIVRTTNKAFDFSLRQYFDTKHEFFVSRLHDVVAENSNEPQQLVEATVPEETPETNTTAPQPASVDHDSVQPSTDAPEIASPDNTPVTTAETSEQTSQTIPVEVKS